MMNTHQPLRGFKYIDDKNCKIYNFIREKYFILLDQYNFKLMIPPIVAPTKLFYSLGESTDIVNKELYNFTQKDGENVTLIPEYTRVMIEQFAYEGKKPGSYAAFGPCFRYERPQKGRYRSFTQGSIEIIGESSFYKDIELILLIESFLKSIYIENYILHINTIGKSEDRQKYILALEEYFKVHVDQLSLINRNKFNKKNFLRILDSKEENDEHIIKNAPKIQDYLSEESIERHNNIKKMLDKFNVNYLENHFLVRGLDYYNDFIFEYTHPSLGSHSSIMGGGRYDSFCKEVINTDLPGLGVGFGIDRLMLVLENLMEKNQELEKIILNYKKLIHILPIETNDGSYALEIKNLIIKNNNSYKVSILYNGKLSKRLEKSNESHYIIVIGETEEKHQTVIIKNTTSKESITLSKNVLLEFLLKNN